jgi:membrane fusion protein, multidrug efflux system
MSPTSFRSPLRRLALASGLGLAISLLAAGCSRTSAQTETGNGRSGRGGGRGGAQPVVTTKVSQKDVPVDIAAVGNVEACVSISVKSQVTGQLQQAFFHEGDLVKKGDKLFEIDQRPLQAALDQAQATFVRDQALLNQAEAQLNRDKANAQYQQLTSERQSKLVSAGLLSKDSGDQSRASADATEALVKSDEANVESARATLTVQQAAVENAKVQLSYTVIRSPIDGRTGNNTLKVGNLATANNAELVTIDQLQPVYVTFAVPAVHLSAIKSHINGKDPLTVFAASPDAGGQPIEGKLTFVDNAVDPTTDTIKLKATFPNSDLRLWPGQFSRVTLRLATLKNATVVPSQAVQTGQDGQFVFLVTPDSTVEQRPITVAQRMGEDVVIEKGLQPGDTIVTEGQLRLEAGTRVQLQDASNPSPGGARGDSAGRADNAGRGRGGRGNGRGGQGQPAQQTRQTH